jgi:hypothetical protein
MSSSARGPAFERFMATADAVGQARPEVGVELARELFDEAATLIHNSLALDGLDEHDTDAVVDALCLDLVAPDPGAAIRARSQAAGQDPELHDPEGAAAAYLNVVTVLRL